MTTGPGDDQVTVYAAQANHTFHITTGSGADTVVLDGDPGLNGGNSFSVSLGAGDDTAQIAGTRLAASQTLNLDGGDDPDSLLYDVASHPIEPAAPALSDGSITIQDAAFVTVNYVSFEMLPGFVGPTRSSGGAYTIDQGQSLALHGSATAATNTQILAIA